MNVLHSNGNVATEWSLNGCRKHKDPWGEIEVSALITGTNGFKRKLPLFWAGGSEWRLRVSVSVPGKYKLKTECSDKSDKGLHGKEATLVVTGNPDESNPLFKHGPVRVTKDAKFAHEDGTPFFWLGDTWWMMMSNRVRWPDDFTTLTRNRVSRGFTVAQVVLGFAPDLATDDPRNGNEGGVPWEPDMRRINPRYFDVCDQRIQTMIREGLMPCILGSWGYHLLKIGEDRMVKHWRYLVARYSAWPVVWSLAGEGAMCYYLSKDRDGDTEKQRAAWSRISKIVRNFDPYKRPLSIHPRRTSWDDLEDSSSLDYNMLQPGHMRSALSLGVSCIEDGRSKFPQKPVVNAEPPYEGHMGTNGPEIQRFTFWSSILSGATGFTYGAAGIFQANDRERPTGDRPGGGAFDVTTWDEAISFPGAEDLGKGKSLLMEMPWHKFEPHPEWATTSVKWGIEAYDPPLRTYCAGVPKVCRVVYVPRRYWHWDGAIIHGIEKGVRYRAFYVDPDRFTRYDLGIVKPDSKGDWQAPNTPYLMEWLIVLKREA